MRHRVSVANGRGSQRHNRRDFFAENVDKSRTKDNIVLVDRPLKEAYQEAFSEAIEEYNKGQKQKCRKLTVKKYMDKIEQGQGKENNPKLFYETIIQVGDMDTAGIKDNPKTAEEMKKVLVDYFKDFQKRTDGHLVITGAYIHMDEATPHMHIDWIPTARGYKKGMQVRNSLEKAMGQMGHVTKGEKTKRINNRAMWQEYERNRLCEVAKTHGIEAYWEKHDTPELNVDVPTFKKLARMSDRKLEQTAELVQEQAAANVQKIENTNSVLLAASMFSSGKQELVNAYSDIETSNLLREEQYKAKKDSEKADIDREKARLKAQAGAQAKRADELDARERAIQEQEAESAKRQAMRDAEINDKISKNQKILDETKRREDNTARMLNEISTKEAQAKAYNDEGWEMYQDAMQVKKANEQECQALNKEKKSLKPIQEANRRAETEKALKEQEAKRADNNEYLMKKYRSLYEKEQKERAEDESIARRKLFENNRDWKRFAGQLKDRAETAEAQNKKDAEALKAKDQTMEVLKNTVKNLNGYINALRNELDCVGTVIGQIKDGLPIQVRAYLKAYRNQTENARAATSHGKDFPSIIPSAEDVKRIEKELSRPKGVKRHQSHGRDTGR